MANSLDQDFDEVVVDLFEKQPEREIKNNMVGATSKDPDRYAESFNLAKKNNLPVETVENNLDTVKKKDRQQDFNEDFDNLFDETPESFNFLQDKDNANLASDDLSLLQKTENAFKKFGTTAKKGFASGVATNELGRVSFDQNTGKRAFEPAQKEIERLNDIIADDPGRDGFINGFVYPGAKILGQITELGQGALTAGAATGTVAAVAGQLGPQVLVPEEVVTVPAAFGAGAIAYLASQTYIIEAGHTYQTLNEIEKEQGEKMDPLVKNGAAAFVGLANAGLEMVGVKYAVAPFRGAIKEYLKDEGKDVLVNKTKTAAIRKFATEYTKAVGAETATEIMQEVVNVTAEQFAGSVSYEDFQGASADENINRILDTATEVMRGMAFLGAVGPGAGLHVDYSKARKAQRNKELMVELGEDAQNSKLLKRAPERFREFVSKVKGNVESVYFDANEFETYFQSKDLDPSEVASQLGVESKYIEAKETGAAIEIPLENYAEKMAATEYHQDLVNSMKFSPDDMTSTQAEEIINRGINEILESEAKLAQESQAKERQEAIPSDRVFNDIKDQLRKAGRSFDVAEREASLHKAFFQTLSKKTGVDAYSLYKGQNISIKRELPESIKAKNIDEQDLALEKLRSYRGISDKKAFGDSLIEFISNKGGINPNDNQAGDLQGMDLDKYHERKKFSKKVFQDKGQFLDDIALAAWENGYFPELGNRPTIDDLVAKIDQELRGEPQYSDQQGDTNLQEELQNLDNLDQFLNEIGADINTMTNQEIKDLIEGYQDNVSGEEFFQPAPKLDTEAFKNWFGNSKVVDEKGNPLVIYHGSTNNIEAFTTENANPESDLGSGIYFSNSKEDVAENYAGQGPDLTGKIEQLASRLQKNEKLDSATAFQRAKNTFSTNQGATYPVYMSLQNPVELGGKSETILKQDSNLIETIRDIASTLQDVNIESLIKTIEGVGENIKASTLHSIFKNSSASAFVRNGDNQFVRGDFFRQVMEKMGYDGIIDRTIDKKFGSGRAKELGEPMTGVNKDTVHYVAFQPNQVKSTFNGGAFSKDDNRILFQDDYRGVHTAPIKDGNNTLDNATDMYGDDIYDSSVSWRYYGHGGDAVSIDKESARIIAGFKDKPNAKVKIYRAVPKGVKEIHTGDWITINKNYAKDHGERHLDEAGFDIIEKTVKAKDIATDGNSIHEWGYSPENIDSVTDSQAFKDWFGTSQVVDGSGEPLVMYHGTPDASFNEFKGDQFFTSDKEYAKRFLSSSTSSSSFYGVKDNKPQVFEVYIKSDNPFDTRKPEHAKILQEKFSGVFGEGSLTESGLPDWVEGRDIAEFLRDELSEQGFDSVIVDEGRDNAGQRPPAYIVFEPNQIKSIDNQGSFNPNSNNIFFQDTGNKRGSFTTGQGEKMIKLFEKADLSTFLHESGHFFLDVMGETALQENAPAEIKDDFNNILKYLEVDSIDQIKTEQHEKFARAFEAYLYEGKAPSPELASAFARFKAWMIEVYRNISKLNVEIDDNIRGVFDRMLATQEEISNAQELNAYAPILTQENSGMTAEEYQNYLKSAQRATEKSESELLKKTMGEIRRERLKTYKEEKLRVRDQVEEDLMQNPTNQALYYLQNGDLFKGEVSKDLKGLKLSTEKLKETYGSEVLKFMPKSVPPIYKKGGVHPDIVADIFGFDSGDALVKSLWNTNNLKALIEEATEAKMKERHGDILNDGSIQEEALKVIRNDDRANFLATELTALGRRAGKDLPSAKQISKKAAQRFISEMQIKDLKLGKYAAAEVKAAKESQRAVSEGNFGEAVEQKRRQLFNHYIVMEGRKAEDQVDKSLKYLGKFNKKEPRAKIGKAGADYLEQIDQLLENYELKRATTLRKLKSRESLLAFVESEKAKGNPINIAQEIIEQASVVNYKQLNTEKFFGLVDSVKNIEHIARFKNKLLINEEKRSIREIAQEIDQITSKHNKLKKPILNPERKAERTKSFLRGLAGSVTKIQTYIEGMDGGEKIGAVYQYLKAPLDEASNIRADRMAQESDKFSALMIKYYGKKSDTAAGKVKNVISPVENLTKNKEFIASIGESLTLEERLTVAFNWGNPDSREKLMVGRNWSQVQVDEILDTLEKKDWDFVQETWDYIDSFWKESSALERELSGVAADKIEASPINTKHGVYKGGYFPLKYSDTQIEDEKYFQEMKAGGFNSTSVSRSFQKERVSGVKRRVNLSGLSTINSHISEMVNAITMGRAVHNTNKLLKNKRIKDTIENYLSPEAYQDFTLWLEDTASSGVSSSDALSRLMRNLRSTATIGAMGLKLSTTLIQVSGFAQSIVEVGPKNMLNGLTAMFAGGKPWEVMAQVQEKSLFMRDRSKTFNRDINDTVKSFKGEKLSSDLIKVYFYPIAKMQQFVDIPTWLAGYKAALKDGKNEKQAIQAGDLAVENSQGTGLVKGLSPIERGSLSNKSRFNEFVKLFTTFYSYFNTKLNLAVRETQKTNFKSPKEVLKLSSNYLALFWLEAVIGDFILGRLPDFDDDEPEQQFANYSMKLVLGQIAGTLPLAREVASGMQGFDAAPGGIRGLTDVARGLKTVSTLTADVWTDEEIDGYKTAMSLLSLGNVASPVKLPTGQINTTLDAIRRQERGEDVEFIEFFLKSYKK